MVMQDIMDPRHGLVLQNTTLDEDEEETSQCGARVHQILTS